MTASSADTEGLRIPVGMLLAVLITAACLRVIADLPVPYAGHAEIMFTALAMFAVVFRFMVLTVSDPVHGRVGAFDIYILALMILLPLHSAWRAHEVFGQPWLHGILTQRGIWLSGLVMMLVYGMRRGWVTQERLKNGLLLMAWSWLAYCSLMQLLVDPGVYAEKYPSLVAGGGNFSGYEYRFEPVLLVFAALFYFYRGEVERNWSDFLWAGLFLVFLIVVLDKRSLTIALLLTIAWPLLLFLKGSRVIRVITRLVVVATLLAILLPLFAPEQVGALLSRFSESFNVVITGKAGEDVSANARIYETMMAWPYIREHWLLGNGDLSNHWNGGYDAMLGYFYPSDIGIIGGLFVYGVVGLLAFYGQYLFMLNARKSWQGSVNRPFLMSCYGVLFVLFIQSFIRGGLVFTPAISLLFIGILIGMRSQAATMARGGGNA